MLKKVSILCISVAACIALCSCSITSISKKVGKLSKKIEDCQSASMTISLDFEGTISGSGNDTPYIIQVNGSGAMINSPYQEEWQYTSYMEILGDTVSNTYDIASQDADGTFISVCKEHKNDDWETLDSNTPTSEDYLLSQVIKEIEDSVEKTDDESYSSVIRGEALQELISAALDPIQQYDFSSYQWNDIEVPISLTLNEVGLPSSYTADCKIIGQQVAELVSGKTGIRITVDSFVVTVTYADFNRIKKVSLPDILSDTKLFE